MAHYDIYREQLANLYHGYALWEPDPGGQYDKVSIGDVGYIRRGHFHRLFNILLPSDHSSHESLGVPNGFETLETRSSHTVLTLPKDDYYSLNVSATDMAIGAQIAAYVVIRPA
jgi:hypothetical protein